MGRASDGSDADNVMVLEMPHTSSNPRSSSGFAGPYLANSSHASARTLSFWRKFHSRTCGKYSPVEWERTGVVAGGWS